MTSGGQTPYLISTIFNRLPDGTIDKMVTENKEAALKTVGTGPRTDRHTHTDMTNFMIVAHPQMGNYKNVITGYVG